MSARWTSSFLLAVLITVLPSLAGCMEKVSLSDPKLQPLIEAMKAVDREALGFTPFSTNSSFALETRRGGAYDAMLHVDGDTSRTIGFRKTNNGYRWIFEQEIHRGPKWRQTVDGVFREEILVEYQTERVDGVPLNEVYVRYDGQETNLFYRTLTLAEARPIWESWKNAPVEPQPPDISDWDPGLLMFALFMLAALALGFILALLVGIVVLAAAAILLTVGIVSAAVLAGLLRRSVSAGFRVLFLQLGAISGMGAGALGTAAFSWITEADWHSPLRWTIGVVIGLAMGLIIAWLFNQVWSRIAQRLARKLEKRK